MKESNIQSLVLMKATQLGSRLFRINVGQAWTGNKIEKFSRTTQVLVNKGDVVIRKARPFRVGVPKGFHDTAGFTPIEITPDMVGKTVAVFTSAEIKTSTGRVSKEQINFREQVVSHGGISGIVRSPEELENLIQDYQKRTSAPASS